MAPEDTCIMNGGSKYSAYLGIDSHSLYIYTYQNSFTSIQTLNSFPACIKKCHGSMNCTKVYYFNIGKKSIILLLLLGAAKKQRKICWLYLITSPLCLCLLCIALKVFFCHSL